MTTDENSLYPPAWDDALARITRAAGVKRAAERALAAADRDLVEAIDAARHVFVAWEVIGEAAGMPMHTARSAWYRSLPDDHPDLPESLRKRRAKARGDEDPYPIIY